MKIKELCEKYNSIITDKLKASYLKDNINIITYLPFINKVTVANKLAKTTMLDSETGNVNVKSDMAYLLFCRAIIENYTDLEIETDGFYEEYDELNKSGIFGYIMTQISEDELKEFKMLCDMAKEDVIMNHTTPQAFISNQITRIGDIANVILSPLTEKLASMDDKEIEKLVGKLSKVVDKTVK